MCFIVTGEIKENTKYWKGHRSVEVLAYHRKRKTVEILFLLYLNNEKENNTLRILHPGNVRCKLVDLSMGLPWHQDEEPKESKVNILESIYGQVFNFHEKEKKFYLKKMLTPWDSLYDIDCEEQKEILAWPPNNVSEKPIESLYCLENESKWIPFSAWKLGPFPNKGEVLIALNTTVQKKSYTELVDEGSFFIVDGPKKLRDRIRHSYIPQLKNTEQSKWGDRLSSFKDCLRFEESYDVVILSAPYADKVVADIKGSSKITEGPLQSAVGNPFKRYITSDSAFKLNLSYADSLFRDVHQFSFIDGISVESFVKNTEYADIT